MVPTVWTISVLFALASLVLAWRVLRSLRHRPGHCTTCGYDCSNLREPTCPECGKPPVATPSRRRLLLLFPAALLMLPLLAISLPQKTSRLLSAVLPARETIATRTIDGVHFVHERDFRLPDWLDSRLRRLEINHEPPVWGEFLKATGPTGTIFELADRSFDFVKVPENPDPKTGAFHAVYSTLAETSPFEAGVDLTPMFFIASYSGGAHCCYTYTFIQLGNAPKVLTQIEFENGAGFQFNTDPASKDVLVTSTDSVWNYWKSCYACTFKPEIILRLRDGVLALAPDLMAKPLPADLADIERRMSEIISAANFTLLEERVEPADYWHFVVELVYTGHEKEAIDLVRRTWTENGPEREIFLAELIANFESSPWAAAMRRHFGN